jgi:hypothetical protein
MGSRHQHQRVSLVIEKKSKKIVSEKNSLLFLLDEERIRSKYEKNKKVKKKYRLKAIQLMINVHCDLICD